MLTDALLQGTLQVAKAFDAGLEILLNNAISREDYLKLPENLRKKVAPPTVDDGINVTIYDPASLPQRIRVEGGVHETKLVEKVTPLYPAHLEKDSPEAGVVQLTIVVAKDGTVIDVKPLAGPEALMDAAMDAVRRYRYKPTLLNGVPVEVQTTVDVSFTPDR